ncbi:SDR family NAD(P)-dependent oxidoreductase [bacterium]|nr:SDR family NAD(P)-dependent oxidoreductase [bacterium]
MLIVGAGEAGQMLARQMRGDPGLGLEPVGFVDDDPSLIGTDVLGLPVAGKIQELVEAADRLAAQEILIAIPSARGSLIRRLVLLCKRAGLPFRIAPGLRAIIDGDVSFKQVRPVAPEDLLGRESVRFRAESARSVVAGRSVLVTGAGGSIGGELCRQLAALGAAEMLLLGRGENSLFQIMGELDALNTGTRLVPIVADIRDVDRLAVLASRHRPGLILHAAAHKHVPLMEDNPEEAIVVNAGGTANLIEFARRVEAERFVLISTDKAAEPSSVMGASKKLAELLVRHAQDGAETRFMTVRFGNVLGSRGSVVPFFLDRIAAGKPLPVTHPEMTRYFMTIREAAMLVIEAMVLGEAGTTYILEMGEPVPILELARNLLVLCGFDPDEGGPGIEIVGMRPGEKLHESLLDPGEKLEASGAELIHRARCRVGDPAAAVAALPRLLDHARRGDRQSLRRDLADVLDRPGLAEPLTARSRT